MKRLMLEQCAISPSPLGDLIKLGDQKKGMKIRRERDAIYRDMMTALAVCHNVTPINNEDGTRSFQASSPDEIALVKIAESVGLRLEKRD
jgi:phospholipid-translocating ATPase